MEYVRYKVQVPRVGDPMVLRMQARSQNVALIGSDTFIGGSLAKAMTTAGRHVMPSLTENVADVSIPDGCNTVLFCHDVSLATAQGVEHRRMATLSMSACSRRPRSANRRAAS